MNALLPDVSHSEPAPVLSPLKWVGMQKIDLPVTVVEPGYRRDVHARMDVQVDLPSPQVKGIHMSRLYRLADEGLSQGAGLAPRNLKRLLGEMVDSHFDCGSKNACLQITLDLLTKRPALMSEGLSGWKAYPVCITATLIEGAFTLIAEVTVEYSSTCPCSAALSRQLIENSFREEFEGKQKPDVDSVAAWLQINATLATPHSQRSEAKVTVTLTDDDAIDLGLLTLIDQVEGAVETPTQTAVKRADEQAFAALNGQNQMFVEDAARRIQAALHGYTAPEVYVRHMESLHPHDAVAWAASDS